MRRLGHILAILITLGVAFGQTDWVRWGSAPVLPAGNPGQWDEVRCIPASVVQTDTGYTMYYTGDDGFGPYVFGVATSPDGYAWTRYPANPLERPDGWEPYAPYTPAVLRDEGTGGWVMFATRLFAGEYFDVCRATSEDGIHWYMDPSEPVFEAGPPGEWDQGNIFLPSVFEWQDTLWMTYGVLMDTLGGYILTGMGLAFSLDRGETWTRDPANPIFMPPTGAAWDRYLNDARVAPWNDTLFVMTYSGFPSLQGLPAIGVATSTDLRQWTRAANNPVLRRGYPSAWDNLFVYQPVLAEIDREMAMYYCGVNSSGIGAIGLALPAASAAPESQPAWVPDNLTLSSHPNPFNASTTITFSLARPARVQLSVCDILGRRVAVLQDAWLPSGRSAVTWDAGGFASGVYYVRLEASGQQVVRPIMLVR